jgi:hypothetical protein
MTERIVAGVSLRQYVAVYAGTSEGFPLDLVLESEGLDAARWLEIDAAWNEAITDDLEAGGTLSDEFDTALFEHQDRYARPIPPLDEDFAAWMRFVRAWSSSSEPALFLQERGLGANDLVRLHRRWAERIEDDPELRRRAAELVHAPGDVPVPEPEPLELRSSMDAPRASRRARAVDAAPDIPDYIPYLSDLPETVSAVEVVKPRPTRDEVGAPEDITTVADSAPPSDETLAVVETTVILDRDPYAAFPVIPSSGLPEPEDVIPAEVSLSQEFGLMQFAALCAELEAKPEDAEATFTKYGLSNPERRERIDGEWRDRLETQTGTYAEWRQLYQHFRDHFRSANRKPS